MAAGRCAGLLYETLAERAEDWLDQTFEARRQVGALGTTLAEQANLPAAAAVFETAYGAARPSFRGLRPVAAGALFGSGLYVVNIVGSRR